MITHSVIFSLRVKKNEEKTHLVRGVRFAVLRSLRNGIDSDEILLQTPVRFNIDLQFIAARKIAPLAEFGSFFGVRVLNGLFVHFLAARVKSLSRTYGISVLNRLYPTTKSKFLGGKKFPEISPLMGAKSQTIERNSFFSNLNSSSSNIVEKVRMILCTTFQKFHLCIYKDSDSVVGFCGAHKHL